MSCNSILKFVLRHQRKKDNDKSNIFLASWASGCGNMQGYILGDNDKLFLQILKLTFCNLFPVRNLEHEIILTLLCPSMQASKNFP
jgi:hypothetical protein